MDTLKAIEKLAQMAKKEKIASYDISHKVIQQVRTTQQDTVSLWPFELFAGISAIAASIVAVFSIQAWRYIIDPLVQLFIPLQEIPLW